MGIMLVYDITSAKSFDNIAKWLRNIDEHANEVGINPLVPVAHQSERQDKLSPLQTNY